MTTTTGRDTDRNNSVWCWGCRRQKLWKVMPDGLCSVCYEQWHPPTTDLRVPRYVTQGVYA